ncbi:MAG: monooxygenase family protein [Pseudonocardiaceae bacterium]
MAAKVFPGNYTVGASELVGIWHETYQVGPGRAEVIYGNMPAFGLAAATRHVRIDPAARSARARLRRGV